MTHEFWDISNKSHKVNEFKFCEISHGSIDGKFIKKKKKWTAVKLLKPNLLFI